MTVNPAIYGLMLLTFVLTVIVAILVVEKIWLRAKNRPPRRRRPARAVRTVRLSRLVQTAVGKE